MLPGFLGSSHVHMSSYLHKQTHTHRDTPWQVQELWSYSFKSLTTKHQKKTKQSKNSPNSQRSLSWHEVCFAPNASIAYFDSPPICFVSSLLDYAPSLSLTELGGEGFLWESKVSLKSAVVVIAGCRTTWGLSWETLRFFYPSECGMDYLLFCELLSIRPTVKF